MQTTVDLCWPHLVPHPERTRLSILDDDQADYLSLVKTKGTPTNEQETNQSVAGCNLPTNTHHHRPAQTKRNQSNKNAPCHQGAFPSRTANQQQLALRRLSQPSPAQSYHISVSSPLATSFLSTLDVLATQSVDALLGCCPQPV